MEEEELCFPKLLNSSCKKLKQSRSETLLISLLLCFISLITVALNLLVIISISHFRQLHNPTNFILLSLAASDVCVGFLLLFQMMTADGCWYFGDFVCILYYVLDIIITSMSVGNMVLISVDRYVAICDPLHYRTKITQKRVQVCVSLFWISCLLYAIVLLRNNFKPGRFNSCSGECVILSGLHEQIVDLIFILIIPVAVIVVLYVRVFVVVVAQVQAMRSPAPAATQQRSARVRIHKSEIKAAVTLGVVVVVFLVCLCPYYCVVLTNQDAILNTVSTAFVLSLFYFNSCLNPLIYAFFYSWLRKAIRVIVTLQILQSGSSDASLL
ncbi:trace amine-associated receptor 8a-like [Poecilia latipinna]|uniref:trace amine-associated receptor 8a-like n=1 Tax=Poecilia latipinna TaxID=48699 RepID=UPI00072DD767|nr:PREDICTED: trace amine-associated receptor 8a-like [Poecilia latipinna]